MRRTQWPCSLLPKGRRSSAGPFSLPRSGALAGRPPFVWTVAAQRPHSTTNTLLFVSLPSSSFTSLSLSSSFSSSTFSSSFSSPSPSSPSPSSFGDDRHVVRRVKELCRSGRPLEALSLWQERSGSGMIEVSSPSHSPQPLLSAANSSCFSALVQHLSFDKRNLELARSLLDTFLRLHAQTSSSPSARFLPTLNQCVHFIRALSTPSSSLSSSSPSSPSLSSSSTEDLARALSLFRWCLQEPGFSPELDNRLAVAMLEGCAHHGNVEEAWRVFHEWQQRFALETEREEAEDMVGAPKEEREGEESEEGEDARGGRGVIKRKRGKLSAGVIGAMMKALCASGRVTEAIELFRSAHACYGVMPNERCFGVLCQSVFSTQDVNTALTLANMILLPQKNDTERKEGREEHNEQEEGLPFLVDMPEIAGLIRVLCSPSPPMLDTALSLFWYMFQNYNENNNPKRSYNNLRTSSLATVLLNACAESKDLPNALRVFEAWTQQPKEKWPRSVQMMGAMLKAYCAEGKRVEALRFLETMESRFGITPNAICYLLVSDASAKAGDIAITEHISRITSSSFNPSRQDDNTNQNDLYLSSLMRARAYCAENPPRLQEAVQLFHTLLKHKVQFPKEMTLVTILLDTCANNKDMRTAQNIIEAWHNNKLPMSSAVAGALMKVYCRCGHREKALELLQQLHPLFGLKPDVAAVGFLVVTAHAAGDMSMLKRLVEMIQLDEDEEVLPTSPLLCSQIIRALSSPPALSSSSSPRKRSNNDDNKDNMEYASMVLSWLFRPSHRQQISSSHTGVVFLDACARLKDLKMAHWGWQAWKEQCSFPVDGPMEGAYMKALCFCGAREEALQLFRETKSFAGFSTLVMSCAKAKDGKVAEQLAEFLIASEREKALPFRPQPGHVRLLLAALKSSTARRSTQLAQQVRAIFG
ncbi:hypothetical protein QOT17_004002 [Balamuthia mandrillaris]